MRQFKLESQRDYYANALVELGKRKDIVVVSADTSTSVKTDMFGKEFPERFFNVGIAEQNMIGIAAGLAASGKIVFASTFAAFGAGRVYDQIRQSIAYPMLNVKIVVSHAGITVGGDGATHQTIEDFALMRVLPNMTVVVPCDAPETYKAVKVCVSCPGPVYIRIGRVDVPTITSPEDRFEIGVANVLSKGDDVTLIGTGIMVARCLQAAEALERHKVGARVINLSTIKPLDKTTLVRAARETGAVVTVEEHSAIMGMGAAVALELAEEAHVPMKHVGLPDVFGESGESEELMVKYGLTAECIVNAAHDVLKRRR